VSKRHLCLVEPAPTCGLDEARPRPVDLYKPCLADPDIMYEADEPEDREYLRANVCGRCVIASACLTEALERDERYGMWGGLDFGHERGQARRLIQARRLRPA